MKDVKKRLLAITLLTTGTLQCTPLKYAAQYIATALGSGTGCFAATMLAESIKQAREEEAIRQHLDDIIM